MIRDGSNDSVGGTLETFINLFHSAHNFDALTIKSNLDMFNSQYDQDEDIEVLRNVLKKLVVEEICKAELDEAKRKFFETCLRELSDWLKSHARRDGAGFDCCLVGCKFTSKKHQFYVRHVKRDHPNIRNIVCNFNKRCKINLSNISAWIEHLKQTHSRQSAHCEPAPAQNPVLTMPCKCDRESCGGVHLRNIGELLKHYNSYHANENRQCMFEDCITTFNASTPITAMNHIRIKHKRTGKMKLKSRYLLLPESNSGSESISTPSLEIMENNTPVSHDDEENRYEEGDFDAIEAEDVFFDGHDDEENSNEHYLAYFSDFLSRLAYGKFVPQTTIQDICEEFIMSTKKLLARQEKVLRESLQNCTNCDIDQIVKDLFENDPFLQAQNQLNTEYKRKLFVQSCSTYVHPKEILLNQEGVRTGSKKEVFHYVPLVDSLNILTTDETFIKMRAAFKVNNDNKIRDIKDGSNFKKNSYFNANPDAYSIILYSDAVEMQNPLGAARGVYKIVFIYYTLCEISKSQRSQIDHLQLVMAFKEKLLKKYPLSTILKPLIEDLKLLELGIEMKSPTRKLKCGVACYVSDNLEASLVGGFSANFSSNDICRICHIQHKDLLDYAHKSHGLWSIEEYDEICNYMFNDNNEADNNSADIEVDAENLFTEFTSESEESDVESEDHSVMEAETEVDILSRGLKSRCSLNALQSFHAVNGFPLDIMHDLFEGM